MKNSTAQCFPDNNIRKPVGRTTDAPIFYNFSPFHRVTKGRPWTCLVSHSTKTTSLKFLPRPYVWMVQQSISFSSFKQKNKVFLRGCHKQMSNYKMFCEDTGWEMKRSDKRYNVGPLKEKHTHTHTKTHWVNKQQRLKQEDRMKGNKRRESNIRIPYNSTAQ